jgi:hypothetical protein
LNDLKDLPTPKDFIQEANTIGEEEDIEQSTEMVIENISQNNNEIVAEETDNADTTSKEDSTEE